MTTQETCATTFHVLSMHLGELDLGIRDAQIVADYAVTIGDEHLTKLMEQVIGRLEAVAMLMEDDMNIAEAALDA